MLNIISTTLVPATAAFPGQAPYDLVDVANARAELGLTDQNKDSDLKRWITQSSAAAAKFCNRVFPVELILDQVYPGRDPYWQVVLPSIEPLQLSRWPIAAPPCVAGTAAPLAPVLSAIAGGVLAAARYYVRMTYLTAMGETAVSAEANLAVASNNLLQVASPATDTQGIATGWNVYVSTASGKEILQNASPIVIGSPWTMPGSGLMTATPKMPGFISVIENGLPRIEGIDFLADYTLGQLTRLDVNLYPKRWPKWPISILYPAGYVLTDPDFQDVVDAVVRMVKGRYYGQNRDPALRSQNAIGVYEAQYWLAAGPGAAIGDLMPDIEARLERYRVPVTG